MFAPIIIPIACRSVTSPAFTKPTVITVVALLLCMTDVMVRPIKTAAHDLLARKLMIFLSVLEVSLCKLSLSLPIPKINTASPPRTSTTSLKVADMGIRITN